MNQSKTCTEVRCEVNNNSICILPHILTSSELVIVIIIIIIIVVVVVIIINNNIIIKNRDKYNRAIKCFKVKIKIKSIHTSAILTFNKSNDNYV